MRFRFSLWSGMWFVTSLCALIASMLSLVENWYYIGYYFHRDMSAWNINGSAEAVVAHAYTAGLSGVMCGLCFVLAVVAGVAAWKGRIK